MKGVEYLRKKLKLYEPRVNLKYKYYDQKDNVWERSFTIPDKMKWAYEAVSGWNTKAVDSLADRLTIRSLENDIFGISEIYNMNNPDILFNSAIKGALISSCDFIYIADDVNEDLPRLRVVDGANATGVMDLTTNLLKEGYAVLSRDENDEPELEAHFEPYRTTYYENREVSRIFEHNVPYPLLVPVVYKSDARRPFGRSRITRSTMYLQRFMKRTLVRMDVNSEFYSFPQKYVTGLDQDAEGFDKWQATVSSMLAFTVDENGQNQVKPGQFQTASNQPLIEQLRVAASLFAGETGLTVDDLGFVSDNPSSAEAIKASHNTLSVMTDKAQEYFNTALINVGYLACCLRDDQEYKRNEFYNVKTIWEPAFKLDISSLAGLGDAIGKINQVIPGYFTEEKIDRLIGL